MRAEEKSWSAWLPVFSGWLSQCSDVPRGRGHSEVRPAYLGWSMWSSLYVYIYIERERERIWLEQNMERSDLPISVLESHSGRTSVWHPETAPKFARALHGVSRFFTGGHPGHEVGVSCSVTVLHGYFTAKALHGISRLSIAFCNTSQ